jgi:hypothetical protein
VSFPDDSGASGAQGEGPDTTSHQSREQTLVPSWRLVSGSLRKRRHPGSGPWAELREMHTWDSFRQPCCQGYAQACNGLWSLHILRFGRRPSLLPVVSLGCGLRVELQRDHLLHIPIGCGAWNPISVSRFLALKGTPASPRMAYFRRASSLASLSKPFCTPGPRSGLPKGSLLLSKSLLCPSWTQAPPHSPLGLLWWKLQKHC